MVLPKLIEPKHDTMIRNFKLTFELYNLFHRSELKHNIPLYKKLGLKKKYYSSISSEDFRDINLKDQDLARRNSNLEEIPYYINQDAETKSNIDAFDELGYCVIKKYLKTKDVDLINSEVDQLLKDKKVKFRYRNKLMFLIHKSKLINKLCRNKELDELLDYLIRGKAKLFQSINFLSGSEQDTHSDSIHMTTFPQGGLLGVWIALEDISLGNGPVHYYPKSHKLPYYMNRDYDNVGSKFMLGNKGYEEYEEMINRKVKEQNIEKVVFTANAGDMFIWHANLLHGGEPHLNKSLTRKSMVLHYFDSKRICYHEITQRPALIKP